MRRGFQRDIFVREGGLREPEAVSEPRQRRVRVRRREQKCRRCFPGGLEGEVWLELKQLSSEPAQWQGGELRFRAGAGLWVVIRAGFVERRFEGMWSSATSSG